MLMPTPAAAPLTALTIGTGNSRSFQHGMVMRFETEPASREAVLPDGCRLARTKAASRAGDDEASQAVFGILDLGERTHDAADHFGVDRIHHFGMIEGDDADIAFDIEFRALEFHFVLRVGQPRLSRNAFPAKGFPAGDFENAARRLSMDAIKKLAPLENLTGPGFW